jgi:hypothetical protein
MKKTKPPGNDLRPEYKRSDFGRLVRGKYAKALQKKSNVIVLEPEIAAAFPNAQAVNRALRGLVEIARRTGSAGRR